MNASPRITTDEEDEEVVVEEEGGATINSATINHWKTEPGAALANLSRDASPVGLEEVVVVVVDVVVEEEEEEEEEEEVVEATGLRVLQRLMRWTVW